MRPTARFLVLVAAVLLVLSCAHMTVPATDQTPVTSPRLLAAESPCGKGTFDKKGQVICIDSNLDAHPSGKDAPVGQGTWVHFYYFDTSRPMDIEFKSGDASKVQFKGCSSGVCWFRVKDDATLGPASYTVKADGKVHDPDIDIVPLQ